jgi:uncharacterized membrane protein YcaP (DUF421 family)
MELVIRGVVVYLFIFVIMRASGNRQFSELTAFDAVLLIIISEATQQALLGSQDFSLTAAFIVISTLIGTDILLSYAKRLSRKADLVLEGVPVLLMEDGELKEENLKAERVDEGDILAAARMLQGLENLGQIKYAVLERNGTISIIPAKQK